MPLSEVLCGQYTCHVCLTMTLPMFLRRIIGRHINCMACSCIQLCVGHHRWSRTLDWNRKRTLSSLRNKIRAEHSQKLHTLAFAEFHRARDAELGRRSLTTFRLHTVFLESVHCCTSEVHGSFVKWSANCRCECSLLSCISVGTGLTC